MRGRRGLPARIFFLLLTIFFVSFAGAEGAEKARIQESFVVNSHTNLLLYFSLDGAISPDMEKGILNGIPVTFAFFVELYEHQNGKGAVQVASKNFQHTLHFETLKEVFLLEQSEHNRNDITCTTLNEAKEVMLLVHDLSVSGLDLLKPGLKYSVKIKAELAKQGLPDKFKNVMTFVKIWDFETEWNEVVFTMADGPKTEKN